MSTTKNERQYFRKWRQQLMTWLYAKNIDDPRTDSKLYERVRKWLLACVEPADFSSEKKAEAKRLLDAIENRPLKKAKPPINQKKNVNGRMLAKMLDDNECRGWTCTQWAEFLKCSPPSVTATQAWKNLSKHREMLKISKRKDRHRRAKGSDQRKRKGQS